MELRHLRCFLAVAEELHFARAAEHLHIERSPLSRAIKELEEKVGAVQFARTTRNTRLIRAGKLSLDHVPCVFAALQQAQDIETACPPYQAKSCATRSTRKSSSPPRTRPVRAGGGRQTPHGFLPPRRSPAFPARAPACRRQDRLRRGNASAGPHQLLPAPSGACSRHSPSISRPTVRWRRAHHPRR